MRIGSIDLYDKSTDAIEATHLAEQNPEIVKKAHQLMEQAHHPDSNWKLRLPRKKK